MKTTLRAVLLFISCLALPFVQSVSAQSSARNAANDFYRMYLDLGVRGLPDQQKHAKLLAMLDPGTRQLIEKARVEQSDFIKKHPDEKPPWIEGDLFSSLFEGAQSFTVGTTRVRSARTEVDVRLSYKEGGTTTNWIDSLVLTRTATGWQIYDIIFKGKWQFKTGSSLRSVLAVEK